ncbi:hypothetical protein [Bacillus sp. EB600]|uniref:hypothetical protein n=1 Tax=Bacillus sp. EB600 TaxID=2806345 RepID=UPI0021088E4D|nr:hypothetical protein [Bacillus sp. EB600]MCQ6281059.1 hypothetical protein [Bacillus sp. EB600]
MGYLEQFARNRRKKEETEVLTARLPKSLYSDFKDYCDQLGLSISEAVYLLVEREMSGSPKENTSKLNISKPKENTTDDKTIDVVVEPSTKATTQVFKEIAASKEATKSRFTAKSWEVDGKLPCPKCNQWVSASNFSRHAKQHGTTTQEIFTNERYKERIDRMIKEWRDTL